MGFAEKLSLAARSAAVFAAGALLTALAAALVAALLKSLLERRGHQLDRWRRVWFHPERELVRLLEALLILSWLAAYGDRFGLGWGVVLAVYALWALHLVADARSYWPRLSRGARHSTLALHERGFFLLDYGSLPLRVGVAALAAALFFLPPVRRLLVTMMQPLLASTEAWFF